MFADCVTIRVSAGRGGDGLASFRREKYVPRGGPDGGDGGAGGSVLIVVNEKIPHLAGIRNNSSFQAANGKSGGKSRKYGHAGEDVLVEVPAGTAVIDADTGELLADLTEHKQKVKVAQGGQGGKGNVHFATPTNRVPQRSDPGTEGETRMVRLELFIPADAALVGFPSSGKSTLHTRLTGSRPEPGGFQFSTRTPRLGVCRINPYSRFRLLDLPSLCEGSSEGQGLGNWFLRHLRRTSLLIFVLDPTIPASPVQQIEILRSEIASHDPEHLERRFLIAVTKTDLSALDAEKRKRLPKSRAFEVPQSDEESLKLFTETIASELGLEL